MNGNALSEALGNLPEDMVAEAMEPARSSRSFYWLRLAACIAIVVGLFFGFWPSQSEIITAPGILTVEVSAVSENGVITTELEKGVECLSDFGWSPAISVYPGLPISLSVETDDFPSEMVTFEVQVSEGEYLYYGEHTDYRYVSLHDKFETENPSVIFWSIDFEDDVFVTEYDHIYTDIVIKCEEHIIGYSILRFDRRSTDRGRTLHYDPFFLYSVMFPKINGEYQNVTYEYVDNEIMKKE